MTEKAFMAQVIQLARLYGYLVYHTHDSRRSAAGFPDLTLARLEGEELRVIFAELKTDTGALTREQQEWANVLMHARGGVEYHLWRPADLDAIVATLALRPNTEGDKP